MKFTIFDSPNNLRKCWRWGGISFYLYTSLVYNCMTYRWKWRRRGGACGANVSFPLIVNYWFRTLYCSKQVQMMLLQYLIVTLFFPVIFFFFPKPYKCLPYKWHQKRCRGQKAAVLRAKIIQFLRETYDQDNRYAESRRWSRQRQNWYDRVPSSSTCDCSLKSRQGRRVVEKSSKKVVVEHFVLLASKL